MGSEGLFEKFHDKGVTGKHANEFPSPIPIGVGGRPRFIHHEHTNGFRTHACEVTGENRLCPKNAISEGTDKNQQFKQDRRPPNGKSKHAPPGLFESGANASTLIGGESIFFSLSLSGFQQTASVDARIGMGVGVGSPPSAKYVAPDVVGESTDRFIGIGGGVGSPPSAK